jgi:hypothetical protein
MNMEGRLTLRVDSWPNKNLYLHPLSKTTIFTYEINHFDPLSQTLSPPITSNTFFHTLHKTEDLATSLAKHLGLLMRVGTIRLGYNEHGWLTHIGGCLTLRAVLHLHRFSKTTTFTYETIKANTFIIHYIKHFFFIVHRKYSELHPTLHDLHWFL